MKKVNNNVWVIVGVALFVAVVASAISAGITANTIKLSRLAITAGNGVEIYTKAEIDKMFYYNILSNNIIFYEKKNGIDYNNYFVVIGLGGVQNYLRASVSQNLAAGRNETTIQSYEDGAWTDVCGEKAVGDICNIGDVSLLVGKIFYIAGGNEYVYLSLPKKYKTYFVRLE